MTDQQYQEVQRAYRQRPMPTVTAAEAFEASLKLFRRKIGIQDSEIGDARRRNPFEELIDLTTDLIRQQQVTHYYTLTFARPVSLGLARFRFNEWVNAIELLQRSRLGWLRAEETTRWPGYGNAGIPLHFHGVLIATPNLNVAQADALWRQLAGDALIERFDPDRDGIPYALKKAFSACGDWDVGGKALRPYVH